MAGSWILLKAKQEEERDEGRGAETKSCLREIDDVTSIQVNCAP